MYFGPHCDTNIVPDNVSITDYIDTPDFTHFPMLYAPVRNI